jgi:hypothetical protein
MRDLMDFRRERVHGRAAQQGAASAHETSSSADSPRGSGCSLENEDRTDTERLADLLLSEEHTRWIFAQLHGARDPAVEGRESVLLLRCAVVGSEFAQLQRLERVAPPQMFTGRFTRVHEVASYVLDLVGRINTSLVQERARARLVDAASVRSSAPVSQHALYQLALDNAEWAFSIIGADPDVVAFLREGARARSRGIRSACHVLGVLLGVQQ